MHLVVVFLPKFMRIKLLNLYAFSAYPNDRTNQNLVPTLSPEQAADLIAYAIVQNVLRRT